MNKVLLYLLTIYKLGLVNVLYIIWYKASLITGIRKVWFKQKKMDLTTSFFQPAIPRNDFPSKWKEQLIDDANRIIKGEFRYYGYHWKEIGNPPNWFLNPFNNQEYPLTHMHWTMLPDFYPSVGDIKNIWEASRFEWVVTLARAYAVTGDIIYLNTINKWLADWLKRNPFNTGPNWKCGQEASIRLFNLINSAFILNQFDHSSDSLAEFIYHTLNRVNGNLLYALAQDNNHGTSEAAGLYIGGEWLRSLDHKKYKNAARYAKRGRYWLENRVKKLITPEGNFSQHSITYQRVLIDTLCYTEFWRRNFNSKKFSREFYQKSKAAVYWLYQFTDSISGNAPNLGGNDGAMILNIHSCNYRNFKPTLQLAAKLFYDTLWFGSDKFNEGLLWFHLNTNKQINAPDKTNFSSKGYALLNNGTTWAMIRWPWFHFRPSHNDVMHLDVWYNGKNIICDAGAYSYNPDKDYQLDLTSVHSHNTVSFDYKEQMPKLSRFLLAKWLKPNMCGFSHEKDSLKWSGAYQDSFGNRHQRSVELRENKWLITDSLEGNFKKAVIGYTLNTDTCYLISGKITTPYFNIELPEATSAILKNTIVSDYYMEMHRVKRIEIEINQPGRYTTCIILNEMKTIKNITQVDDLMRVPNYN